MRRTVFGMALALSIGFGWTLSAQRGGAGAALYDWVTDGGDNQRTGWNKSEKTLTTSNVKSLKLLWKVQTGNEPRALHALMPALVIGRLNTPSGAKQVAIVSGISDNLYAIDAQAGTILWKKHWDYVAPAGRGGGGGPPPAGPPAAAGPNAAGVTPGAGAGVPPAAAAAVGAAGQGGGGGGGRGPGGAPGPGVVPTNCAVPLPPGVAPAPGPGPNAGFLGPGGSSDVPVIGPADGRGRRPVYFVTGDGMLRTLDAATGEEISPAFCFATGKGWALNLFNDVIWMPHGGAVSGTLLDDPQHKVMSVSSGSGGMWGRRGAAVDSTGTAWSTTGDGQYNPATGQYANSVMGVAIDNGVLKMKDYYTPTNWDWLRKRDLDPNNTPTIFTFKGRELMAASGKECRVYLLDPRKPGGDDHQTPLHKTPLVCNEEVDFQDRGSWGALSSWQEPNGTQWVLVPFWGAVHSQFRAPIMNTPTPVEGGVAAFKVSDAGGPLTLQPAWVSRDMYRGEPVVIANGVVYGYGSGEETRQAWAESTQLYMQGNYRASLGKHATIYALDAQTGKELWSSGDTITSWNHFSGITLANGRVYLGTYDGTVWCFGLQ